MTTGEGGASIPVPARVHLTHAVTQYLADLSSTDLLHIKGPALDASLRVWQVDPGSADGQTRPLPRLSSDADVLVRPAHVPTFLQACLDHGWSVAAHFSTGSAFEHAATLWHNELGYLDVHRFFPGIELDADAAFSRLWADRTSIAIAHRPCWVPSVIVQRFLLILHAARSGQRIGGDLERAWGRADDATRAEILALAVSLRAEVAVAAATGRLEEFRDDPSYDLWRLFSAGYHSRGAEWRARIRAQRTWRGRLRLVGRSFLVNTDHLAMTLRHRPTRREILIEYLRRAGTAAGEIRRLVPAAFRRREERDS
ncbi:MAG: 2-nitropropane dioxygenase [Propioniciclava sp.]